MLETVLETRNLTKQYGDLTAVDALSLEIHTTRFLSCFSRTRFEMAKSLPRPNPLPKMML
jgi:hypothetical protein